MYTWIGRHSESIGRCSLGIGRHLTSISRCPAQTEHPPGQIVSCLIWVCGTKFERIGFRSKKNGKKTRCNGRRNRSIDKQIQAFMRIRASLFANHPMLPHKSPLQGLAQNVIFFRLVYNSCKSGLFLKRAVKPLQALCVCDVKKPALH